MDELNRLRAQIQYIELQLDVERKANACERSVLTQKIANLCADFRAIHEWRNKIIDALGLERYATNDDIIEAIKALSCDNS